MLVWPQRRVRRYHGSFVAVGVDVPPAESREGAQTARALAARAVCLRKSLRLSLPGIRFKMAATGLMAGFKQGLQVLATVLEARAAKRGALPRTATRSAEWQGRRFRIAREHGQVNFSYAFSFNQARTSSWLPVIISCSRFGLKKRKTTRMPREMRNSRTLSCKR